MLQLKSQPRRRSVIALTLALALCMTVLASATATLNTPMQKRYKATRLIVVDKQTTQLRMPTQQEIDEAIENLATLTKRSAEGLRPISSPSGGLRVDLGGGFNGVMLARPKVGGTWETKCVFTLEEGAEFLGLVEEN
jgi:hypothetical protein